MRKSLNVYSEFRRGKKESTIILNQNVAKDMVLI